MGFSTQYPPLSRKLSYLTPYLGNIIYGDFSYLLFSSLLFSSLLFSSLLFSSLLFSSLLFSSLLFSSLLFSSLLFSSLLFSSLLFSSLLFSFLFISFLFFSSDSGNMCTYFTITLGDPITDIQYNKRALPPFSRGGGGGREGLLQARETCTYESYPPFLIFLGKFLRLYKQEVWTMKKCYGNFFPPEKAVFRPTILAPTSV